jgi:hypothetical protein
MVVNTNIGTSVSFVHTDGKSLYDRNGIEWKRDPEMDVSDRTMAAYTDTRTGHVTVLLNRDDLKRICKGDKAMMSPTTVAEMRDYTRDLYPKARKLVDEWPDQKLREILTEADEAGKDPGTALEQIVERMLEEQEARNRPPEAPEAPREPRKDRDSYPSTPKRSRAKEGLPVASEGVSVVLTPKQVEFMERLSEIPAWSKDGVDGKYVVSTYAEELSDTLSPMSVGALVTTLREKHLIVTEKTRIHGVKECVFQLTDDGKKIYKALSRKE